jgi:hypothetical protein
LGILGFVRLPLLSEQAAIKNKNNNESKVDIDEKEENILHQLDELLQHVNIGGQHMTGDQFVNIDSSAPSFDVWSNNSEDPSVVNILPNEDDEENDLPNEDPPNLPEAMDMLHRLHLLSSIDYPQLHSTVSELESKLIDIYLEKKTSKQSTIYDYFSKK